MWNFIECLVCQCHLEHLLHYHSLHNQEVDVVVTKYGTEVSPTFPASHRIQSDSVLIVGRDTATCRPPLHSGTTEDPLSLSHCSCCVGFLLCVCVCVCVCVCACVCVCMRVCVHACMRTLCMCSAHWSHCYDSLRMAQHPFWHWLISGMNHYRFPQCSRWLLQSQ